MIYIKGNVLDAPANFIVHGVNTEGKMGRGVAKEIKERWPHVFQEYVSYCDEFEPLLGKIQIISIGDDRYIVNAFTQSLQPYVIGDGYRKVSYDALDSCFANLSLEAVEMMDNPTIALPKIGAGLGYGDWGVIEKIIERNLKGIEATVYEL